MTLFLSIGSTKLIADLKSQWNVVSLLSFSKNMFHQTETSLAGMKNVRSLPEWCCSGTSENILRSGCCVVQDTSVVQVPVVMWTLTIWDIVARCKLCMGFPL